MKAQNTLLRSLAAIMPIVGLLVFVGFLLWPANAAAKTPAGLPNSPDCDGKIVIVEDTIPNDPQNFHFSLTNQNNFDLDDDSNVTLPNTRTFSALAPGTYYATDINLPANWDLTQLTCSDPTNNTTVSLSNKKATISLNDYETVTCTFTHKPKSKIVIVEDTVPNGPQDFSFNLNNNGAISENFLLDDDGEATLPTSRTFNMPAGTWYALEPSEPPAPWILTGLVCEDPSGNTTVYPALRTATIVLGINETVTCTFKHEDFTHNIDPGTIVIVENTIPDDLQDFSFKLTSIGSSDVNLQLDDDSDPTLPTSQSFSLPPGIWNASEPGVPPSPWLLIDLECVDPTANTTVDLVTRTATINLDSLETVTCTFTHQSPTAVTMGGSTARLQGQQVLVEWTTVNEVDMVGFNIYRSETQDGQQTLLTYYPATGGSFDASYQFVDNNVAPGKHYIYWIELVEVNGQVEMLEPVTYDYSLYLPAMWR